MSKIIQRGNKVIKQFVDNKEALKYQYLFNTFPNHVSSIVEGDKLTYTYVEGKLLEEMLNENLESLREIFQKLGEILGKVHFENIEIKDSYLPTLLQRGHFPYPNYFSSSKLFLGSIHGDLNPENIIITYENFIVFIDRLDSYGDIMFDFPFIMSLLCKKKSNNASLIKNLLDIFFSSYFKYNKIPEKEFFISFRNNFLNYGYFLYEHQKNSDRPFFMEWKKSKSISNDLAKFQDFKSYYQSF